MTELKLGRYRHFKGRDYQVLEVVKDSETEQDMVLYRPLEAQMQKWVRSLQMFVETVEVKGVPVPRFKFIGDVPDLGVDPSGPI